MTKKDREGEEGESSAEEKRKTVCEVERGELRERE